MKGLCLVLALFVWSLPANQSRGRFPEPVVQTTVKKDKKLWGTWIRVSHAFGGERPVTAGYGPFRVVITAKRFDHKRRGLGTLPGTYTIDPTKSPKTIDIVGTVKTILKGKVLEVHQETWPGIY